MPDKAQKKLMEVAVFEAFVKTDNSTEKSTSKTALANTAFEILKLTGKPWDEYKPENLNKKNRRYNFLYQLVVN